MPGCVGMKDKKGRYGYSAGAAVSYAAKDTVLLCISLAGCLSP